MVKKPKIPNKFYVGSNTILNERRNWAKSTLAAAVEHAKQLAEDDGEAHFVVQIVRVVYPKTPPIVVEKV